MYSNQTECPKSKEVKVEIEQFVREFGDVAVLKILSNVPEFIQKYPRSAAYCTKRRNYVLTHVSNKKPFEIYLHELSVYAKAKNLKMTEPSRQK